MTKLDLTSAQNIFELGNIFSGEQPPEIRPLVFFVVEGNNLWMELQQPSVLFEALPYVELQSKQGGENVRHGLGLSLSALQLDV